MGLQNLVFYCENVNIYELLVIIYVALCTGTIIKDLLPWFMDNLCNKTSNKQIIFFAFR